jgi:hypothetical protein
MLYTFLNWLKFTLGAHIISVIKNSKHWAGYGGRCLKSSIQEAEAGGAQVQGQPVLHSVTLNQEKKKKALNRTKYD